MTPCGLKKYPRSGWAWRDVGPERQLRHPKSEVVMAVQRAVAALVGIDEGNLMESFSTTDVRISSDPGETSAFEVQSGQQTTTITREQYAEAYSNGYEKTTRFLVSRAVDFEIAEETSQAAWARGWEHRHKLRNPAMVLSWVNTIALNLFRNWYRRREAAHLIPEISVPPQTSPQAIDVQRALSKCAPADREMLEKHYVAGYTSAELGHEMGCTPVAVRVRVLRARRRIRKKIGDETVQLRHAGAG
jgi:RNA polymerase sigma-70 factor (ECF subfamily)